MSLVDDLKAHYASGEKAPPTWDSDFEFVQDNYLSDVRWGTVKEWIFKKDDESTGTVEFAAVKDVEPATEMQEWGDYGEPEIYTVVPKVVSTTVYVKA